MDKSIKSPVGKEAIENKDKPNAILPIAGKNSNETDKEEVEIEVKESFQDEDVPVEPVLGNDGDEVGGEG